MKRGTAMLEAMRQLALDALWVEIGDGDGSDPEAWYQELRAHDLGRLFPKLVEDIEQESGKDNQRYYTLRADPKQADTAILEAHEFKQGDSARLPFNQPTGSQSAAFGPIIKRTAGTNKKEPGPTAKTLRTTRKSFKRIAQQDAEWSSFFRRAYLCFCRLKLRDASTDRIVPTAKRALAAAIEEVQEKRTVLIAYQDRDGKLPGDVREYVDYLQEVLARSKYATAQVPPSDDKTCSLCGRRRVRVFPNALRGAGINLGNLDRDGAFPGLEPSESWKGFALCVACADLLYVYFRHVKNDYRTTIAGENALVVPTLQIDPGSRRKFAKGFREFVSEIDRTEDAVVVREKKLMNILRNENAVTTLTILWAKFGHNIEDIRGIVTDVLPSRLQKLVEFNRLIVAPGPVVFPEFPLEDFQYNLPLTILKSLLRRPGGKAAEKSNASRRLFDLRLDLAEAIYHATALPRRFFDEIHETARWHFDAVCNSGSPWGLFNEGLTKDNFPTMAAWARQLARFFHYLRLIGVLPMPDIQELYHPSTEALKPYFSQESAIRGPARAFAFIMGVLYGKLLQVQGARGVNVSANALTWLKRLTLSGRDLPEFYVKVREKLLAYETEGNPQVRQVVTELGELGAKLGMDIQLDETETCYFLLIGQSLATKIMPSKQPKQGKGKNHV
jgi:CRISPR-associated protein Csh1